MQFTIDRRPCAVDDNIAKMNCQSGSGKLGLPSKSNKTRKIWCGGEMDCGGYVLSHELLGVHGLTGLVFTSLTLILPLLH